MMSSLTLPLPPSFESLSLSPTPTPPPREAGHRVKEAQNQKDLEREGRKDK